MSIQENSVGDLQREKSNLDGIVAGAAGAMNAGQKPDFTGGQSGDSILPDVAMAGGAHTGVQIASEVHEQLSSSQFYQPNSKKSKRPTDALGLPVSRRDMVAGMKQESRLLWHVARHGRMPVKGQGHDVFQRAGGSFGDSKFIKAKPGDLQFKFLRWTPEMVMRFLVTDELKRTREMVTGLIAKPTEAQIDAGIAKNEKSGTDLLANANSDMQERVIDRMGETAQQNLQSAAHAERKEELAAQKGVVPKKPKPAGLMAPKPPTAMMGGSSSDEAKK